MHIETLNNNKLIFPKHNAGLCIEHNPHLSEYLAVEIYIETYNIHDWVSEKEKDLCCKFNEMWLMTWYPDTAIGFYQLAGFQLKTILEKSLQIDL